MGAESFAHKELIESLARLMRLKRLVFPCRPRLAYWVDSVVGWIQNDIFITWPEVEGLMASLLDTPEPPDQVPVRIRPTQWAARNSLYLGCCHASELSRR